MIEIKRAETKNEILKCSDVMRQLRPHLSENEFVSRVERQFAQGYQLICLAVADEVRSVAGFRIGEMLSRGKYLYVDDLVTDKEYHSQGYGGQLFDWLVEYARAQNCERLDLDSGVQLAQAHGFYFNKKLQILSFHFAIRLNNKT